MLKRFEIAELDILREDGEKKDKFYDCLKNPLPASISLTFYFLLTVVVHSSDN